MAKDKQSFCLEGQFEGFMAGDKSPFKYLSLADLHGRHRIKLSKSVQVMLFGYLQVGDSIRVVGKQSTDQVTGEPKFKAREVVKIKPRELVTTQTNDVPQGKPTKANGKPPKILICQKSTCRKRGAAQVCREVEAALANHGLTDTVGIQLTGCMDKCGAGPNLVVMPHKQRYTKVKPGQVAELIAQHFQQNDAG
ncbi:(2Fe-2S) ferredoxin domain-containing protein [Leptothoe sp. PORK10 BA2]|uniref:(2Fe-2S) ferredoxin domain-containing protein n=1 Tax=Leptothoe sp. PORK10 BA2 TaxID=3110254 RepID=UPI002B2106CE|nr:(2Fe-2S) ferredoxin domain-containing protein [Leptothoe sp. PORK10 BA2]MEA5464579.1 (2Fe-2S) ferredoxin domain-containing protein [Leptothoe sp. PORK10 BA2]